MSFFQIKQTTLTGERKTFINLSAVAYIQELTPDQDPGWQVGVEPSRALIFLHQKIDPIISINSFEDIAKQMKALASEGGPTISTSSKNKSK